MYAYATRWTNKTPGMNPTCMPSDLIDRHIAFYAPYRKEGVEILPFKPRCIRRVLSVTQAKRQKALARAYIFLRYRTQNPVGWSSGVIAHILTENAHERQLDA